MVRVVNDSMTVANRLRPVILRLGRELTIIQDLFPGPIVWEGRFRGKRGRPSPAINHSSFKTAKLT